jgi:hypothetical protein
MNKKPMILIAGPYRSGTGDDPDKIKANMQHMNRTALAILEKGYLPVLGEWTALPLIHTAGSTQMGDKIWEEIFHPTSLDLLAHCHAVLRIGGPSQGADLMVWQARTWGKPVFYSVEEVDFSGV